MLTQGLMLYYNEAVTHLTTLSILVLLSTILIIFLL